MYIDYPIRPEYTHTYFNHTEHREGREELSTLICLSFMASFMIAQSPRIRGTCLFL